MKTLGSQIGSADADARQPQADEASGTSTSLRVRKPIYLGFTGISFILVLAIILTLANQRGVTQLAERLTDLRLPTAETSSALVADTYAVQLKFSQWMATADPALKAETSARWREIDDELAEMRDLSRNWTNPENVQRLDRMERDFEQLRTQQMAIFESSGDASAELDGVLLLRPMLALGASILEQLIGGILAESSPQFAKGHEVRTFRMG